MYVVMVGYCSQICIYIAKTCFSGWWLWTLEAQTASYKSSWGKV